MSNSPAAYVAGIYEHPTRKAVGLSVPQMHADVAYGALTDAGLSIKDVDGYFCAGDAPGLGGITMAEYLGLKLRYTDSTETGGSSYIAHLHHAVNAIAAGKCNVALITMADNPLTSGLALGLAGMVHTAHPDLPFNSALPQTPLPLYALAAQRHMHEFGTTSEQLAWVRVAASQHAQHNPNAMYRTPLTVEDVLNSPVIADPLHRLDCCVMSDGGGAVVITRAEIAKTLRRPLVKIIGVGEAAKHNDGGKVDITYSAGRWSAPIAFEQAGVKPSDIKYVSLYDSFTITVVVQLEDLGFCVKGAGGRFVADGNLISGVGKLPFNTDGGGLCNNHPGNRGGITKILEAVRQTRGEAHPAVQVRNCDLTLAHGTGGILSGYHVAGSAGLRRGRHAQAVGSERG